MEGITILTEATGMGLKETFILILVHLLSILFSILVMVIGFEWLENKFDLKDWFYKIITVVGVISAICFCCFITYSCHNLLAEDYNSYKITIDDSVSFNEFNEKYKVLKQEGEIFTVVEREVKDNDK